MCCLYTQLPSYVLPTTCAACNLYRLLRPVLLCLHAGGMNGAFDPTTQSLPPKVIEDLLYPKYIARYARCVPLEAYLSLSDVCLLRVRLLLARQAPV